MKGYWVGKVDVADCVSIDSQLRIHHFRYAPFCNEEVGLCKVYFQDYIALVFQRKKETEREGKKKEIVGPDGFIGGNSTKHLKEN